MKGDCHSGIRHRPVPQAIILLACFALASGSSLASAPAPAATHLESADAFPYALAFNARTFPHGEGPVASPSGDRVAYVVITPPENQPQDSRFLPSGTPVTAIGASVHIASVDARSATASTAVCDGEGNQWSPAWSPDGSQLAFYSDAGGRVQAWIFALASQSCRRVSDAAVRGSVFQGSEPRWSPDGETLYVPLDPNPPDGAISGTYAQAPNATAGGIDAKASGARVHFGGGEAGEAVGEASRSGSYESGMMRQYNATLAALSLSDGQVRTLVPAAHETRPNRLELSPSGRWVSYISVMRHSEEISTESVTDLQVVASRGGAPRHIETGLKSSEHNVNYTRADYRWHPTRDSLYYLKDGGLWTVDVPVEGPAAPRRLAEELGELAPAVLYFSADGNHLLVGLDPQGVGRDRAPRSLALVPLSGGTAWRMPLPDASAWQFLDLVRANEHVLWQPGASALSVVLRERATGEQAVMRIDIGSGKRSTLAKAMSRTSGFAAGGNHAHLIAIHEDIATPPDLYLHSSSMVRGQRLSIIEPRLQGRRYGSAEVVETRTPQHDGSMASVRTTLLLPPGAKRTDRLPGIVMIYSGSDLSTRASYFGGGMGNSVPSQIFTSRGYVVIMANIVLGREGEASDPAQQMTDEVLAQVYAVANAGYIDISRLAVSGQSYGGYSTASIVSHTHLFRAGIPVNGTFDLGSFYGGMDDSGNSHWIRWAEKGQGRMGDHPWVNSSRYIDNSPYYRIDRIRTPLLLVAGEKDSTVPYEESKKLFVGLRRLERPVQLAIYPGEGHVIATWSTDNAVDASRRMVAFLDRHLCAVDE